MSKALLRLAILSAPLVLTACGEGWEVSRTSDYGTYEMDRTAGTGVAYVRAKMLPEKEIVVEPMMEEISPEAQAPEPVMQAEEIFTEAQRKGSAQEKMEEPVAEAKEEMIEEVSEIKTEAEVETKIETEAVEELLETEEVVEEEDHSSFMEIKTEKQASMVEPAAASTDITAEEYIAQAPKRIIAPKVEVIKSNTSTEETLFMKTAGIDGVSEEVVEIFENEVIQPQKQIIVPKKDTSAYLSVGEETLEEIYDVPF